MEVFLKTYLQGFPLVVQESTKGKPFKGKGGNEVFQQMDKFEFVRQQIPLISEHLRFL